jgi:hypothetical protein
MVRLPDEAGLRVNIVLTHLRVDRLSAVWPISKERLALATEQPPFNKRLAASRLESALHNRRSLVIEHLSWWRFYHLSECPILLDHYYGALPPSEE